VAEDRCTCGLLSTLAQPISFGVSLTRTTANALSAQAEEEVPVWVILFTDRGPWYREAVSRVLESSPNFLGCSVEPLGASRIEQGFSTIT